MVGAVVEEVVEEGDGAVVEENNKNYLYIELKKTFIY